MPGRILDVLLCVVVIGATSVRFTQAVDSQMLTFLLNEMSNYRTSSLVMENDIKELKSALANLTSQNAQLQRLVTSLNSQCSVCDQNLIHNVSKLNTDIQAVAKATNISVLFIDKERAVFEDRIEKLLLNHSTNFKAQIENLTHNVIFSVYGSPGNQIQFNGVIFKNISVNSPANYEAATGRYTIPEDGLYTLRITDGITPGLNNNSPFMVDGVRQKGCFGIARPEGAFSVCQIHVYLHSGQQVWVRDFNDFIHTNTTVFSGWKM